MITMIVVLILASIYGLTDGVRILMIPGNVNSHVLKFGRLAEALSEQGHTIRMILPSNNPMLNHASQKEHFTVTRYAVKTDIAFTNDRDMSESMIRIGFSDSDWERIRIFEALETRYNKASVGECESVMENILLIQMLKDDNFQFAIIDPWLATSCYLVIPQMLNIPFAIYSYPTSWLNVIARIPRLPSFTPFISTEDSDEMTFRQRLFSCVLEILAQVNFGLKYELETMFVQKYLDPNMETSYPESMSQASLWLMEEDLSLSYPHVHMPNSISIAHFGDKARPVKPLSEDLESFLRSSPEPAILVSFGSIFDYVPESIAREFCDAFSQLKYQVIWKLKNESHCTKVKNVKILNWIPQNDLLAHDKVRLFVTHGGFNSMVETVYHVKPVLIMPIAFDQINLAAFVVSRGMGIRMYFHQFTIPDFINNVEKVLADPKYKQNMQKASAIMRDQPNTAAEKASYLINHVVKHGDKHLKTGALKLSLFQYYMFDIYLFICFAVIVCFVLLCTCVYCSCKSAFNRILPSIKLKTA